MNAEYCLVIGSTYRAGYRIVGGFLRFAVADSLPPLDLHYLPLQVLGDVINLFVANIANLERLTRRVFRAGVNCAAVLCLGRPIAPRLGLFCRL